MLDVERGVEISMCLIAADLTAKRLLIRPVGSIGVVTHAAFLGGVGTFDSGCSYAPFGRIPGDLLRDMREMGSAHVGVHGSGLVLHRGHRELFIGDLLCRARGLADRL